MLIENVTELGVRGLDELLALVSEEARQAQPARRQHTAHAQLGLHVENPTAKARHLLVLVWQELLKLLLLQPVERVPELALGQM